LFINKVISISKITPAKDNNYFLITIIMIPNANTAGQNFFTVNMITSSNL
jgi:hypothetical protein